MKKKSRKEKDRYLLCIAILCVEGPPPYESVRALLSGAQHGENPGPLRGGPFCTFPIETYEGKIVLASRSNMPVMVFNGRADDDQKLFCVYLVDGSVTAEEIEEARESGDWVIDFSGTIETERDRRGRPIGRRTKGMGKQDVMTGDVVFVRPARPGEPPDQEFWVKSMSSREPPRTLREPILAEIDPAEMASFDLETMKPVAPAAMTMPVRVSVDPVTGNALDTIFLDGAVGFQAGPHDHVVLVLKDTGRILKGTKGDMLAESRGILAGLEREMPDQQGAWDKARAAIDAFDPFTAILVVSLPACDVTAIPRSAFPDVA